MATATGSALSKRVRKPSQKQAKLDAEKVSQAAKKAEAAVTAAEKATKKAKQKCAPVGSISSRTISVAEKKTPVKTRKAASTSQPIVQPVVQPVAPPVAQPVQVSQPTTTTPAPRPTPRPKARPAVVTPSQASMSAALSGAPSAVCGIGSAAVTYADIVRRSPSPAPFAAGAIATGLARVSPTRVSQTAGPSQYCTPSVVALPAPQQLVHTVVTTAHNPTPSASRKASTVIRRKENKGLATPKVHASQIPSTAHIASTAPMVSARALEMALPMEMASVYLHRGGQSTSDINYFPPLPPHATATLPVNKRTAEDAGLLDGAMGSTEEDGDGRPSKARKVKGSGGRGRVSDYPHDVEGTIDLAKDYMRMYILLRHGFPSRTTPDKWANEAWALACEEMDLQQEKTIKIHGLIVHACTHFRSGIRDELRHTLRSRYLFYDPRANDQIAINQNIEWYELLREDCRFIFPFEQLRALKPVGSYTNPAFRDLMRLWFKGGQGALCLRFSSMFPGYIPPELYAFVATLIEFGLSEWSTGQHVEATLHCHLWQSTYDAHLYDICGELYRDLRASVGAPAIWNMTVAAIDKSKFCEEFRDMMANTTSTTNGFQVSYCDVGPRVSRNKGKERAITVDDDMEELPSEDEVEFSDTPELVRDEVVMAEEEAAEMAADLAAAQEEEGEEEEEEGDEEKDEDEEEERRAELEEVYE
ncbi:hypothetical protein K474DRAFT_1713896 [Panus rudis PR-1116 ss-1]|nr:hypothetical protein K474DRAFT_1713896 [Panus rudis PR-1116 ss-1]